MDDARSRDDRRDPRWHLTALAELAEYLTSHDLAPEGLAVDLGAPATADEIDAFSASRSHPVPESLRALWSVHGSAMWQLGDRSERLLSPREVERRRPMARVAADAYLTRLPPDVAATSAPVLFLADVVRDDGRVFAHAAAHPTDLWWEVSLAWILATRLVADFVDAIAAAVPAVATLTYGERGAPSSNPGRPRVPSPNRRRRPL